MNKYRITIQPIDGPEVSYKVGGFDESDARRQGVDRWIAEHDSQIAEVFVEPLTEESEVQLEAQLYGRRRA